MTSIFEHWLITKGWRTFETKKKKDKTRNCWISPDGKWYDVPRVEHQMFAQYVVEEIYPDHKDVEFGKAGDILVKKGWIYIEHSVMIGTVLRGTETMTSRQYKVLYAYFKNERLFRGWTIALLYRESKGE